MIAAFNSPPYTKIAAMKYRNTSAIITDARPAYIGDVVFGEARQILPENDTRYQRPHQGEDDSGQDLQEIPAARRKPGMQNEQRDDHCRNRNAVARNVEKILVGFDDQRNVAPRRLQHQRASTIRNAIASAVKAATSV
jgi:hypothetical protein